MFENLAVPAISCAEFHKGGTVDRDAPNVSAYFIGISQRQVFDDLDIALVGWRRLEREQALEGTE